MLQLQIADLDITLNWLSIGHTFITHGSQSNAHFYYTRIVIQRIIIHALQKKPAYKWNHFIASQHTFFLSLPVKTCKKNVIFILLMFSYIFFIDFMHKCLFCLVKSSSFFTWNSSICFFYMKFKQILWRKITRSCKPPSKAHNFTISQFFCRFEKEKYY